jgi:hypothetical protein
MPKRRVTLIKQVGSYAPGTTLEVSNVYGSHHIYDYKLSKPGVHGGSIEVTSDMVKDPPDTVKQV